MVWVESSHWLNWAVRPVVLRWHTLLLPIGFVIQVEGLYPAEMAPDKMSVEQFMAAAEGDPWA
jgi:hypothetical protein